MQGDLAAYPLPVQQQLFGKAWWNVFGKILTGKNSLVGCRWEWRPLNAVAVIKIYCRCTNAFERLRPKPGSWPINGVEVFSALVGVLNQHKKSEFGKMSTRFYEPNLYAEYAKARSQMGPVLA